ncbi:MAG: hemin uptake protein HemP [Pirellulaceae bacterium]
MDESRPSRGVPNLSDESQAIDGQTNLPHLKKQPKIVPFEELAHCGDEVWIANGGQLYRLRKTRQGKLILTK